MTTHSAYAIISAGGKQHRVKVGQRCVLEKVAGDPGQSIELDKVILIAAGEDVQIGAPFLSGAKVTAKILQHGRGEKIKIFKMKRRKGYRRTQGHRQDFTEVEVTGFK